MTHDGWYAIKENKTKQREPVWEKNNSEFKPTVFFLK